MVDVSVVANRFLELATARGDTLSPMQLIKLVYIAHGWNLGLYGTPLIREEIQAWRYGPVIPRLYNLVRKFRSQPVEGRLDSKNDGALAPQEDNLIQQVYDIYGQMTGMELSRLTHAPGTPWQLTYKPGEFGLVISSDVIEDHYSRLAKSRGAVN